MVPGTTINILDIASDLIDIWFKLKKRTEQVDDQQMKEGNIFKVDVPNTYNKMIGVLKLITKIKKSTTIIQILDDSRCFLLQIWRSVL